jgi:D-alanyl-lipoteichoic acid acyltransferase DltB (MBOAT superfamily)
MLFQTQGYVLVFLPLVAAFYYLSARSLELRQYVLIAASLVFYAWWDVRFLVVPLAQITATWVLSQAHGRTGRAGFLHAAVLLNLASLGTFKYLNFLLDSVGTATGIAFPRMGIVLPIGISFFTFQLVSYLVDRMRGEAPLYPFRPFALFILLYPHLIAGPIVRHHELIPQFALDPLRDGLYGRIARGLAIFTMGFAKKVLLADALAPAVDGLFSAAAERPLDFGQAWTAILAFAFQLFLDFSAYTEMAIGTALIFGLILPENFRRPYLADSIAEFWRRWHITLSNFIRDYLYVPLAASRAGLLRYVPRGRPRVLGAILVSMGLCGLWHGAGWTYVAWGFWHGAGLVTCHLWQRMGRPLPSALGWALTMLFVLASFALFRADSFSVAGSILASLCGLHGVSGALGEVKLLVGGALASTLLPSAHELNEKFLKPRPMIFVGLGLLAAYCVLEVGRGPPLNFIYFQF